VTPSGIEPETYWRVAQYLKQLRHRVAQASTHHGQERGLHPEAFYASQNIKRWTKSSNTNTKRSFDYFDIGY
jgi:hypothetical protein